MLEDARSISEGLWRVARLAQDVAESLDARIEDEDLEGLAEAIEVREAPGAPADPKRGDKRGAGHLPEQARSLTRFRAQLGGDGSRDVLRAGGALAYVIAPPPGELFSETNANSVAILLSFGMVRVLLGRRRRGGRGGLHGEPLLHEALNGH